MKFLCDSCHAKYQIPDDKVAGRTVRMKCRKCEHVIVIDGTVLAGAPTIEDAAHPRPTPVATSDAPPPPERGLAGAFGALEAPAAAADVARPSWYAGIEGTPVGPLTEPELRDRMSAGAIGRDTLVWRDGMAEWVAVESIPALGALLASATAVPPPPAATLVAAPLEAVRAAAPAAPTAPATVPASSAPVGGPAEPAPATVAAAGPAPAVSSIAPVASVPAPAPAADTGAHRASIAPSRPPHKGGVPLAAVVVVALGSVLVGMVIVVALLRRGAPPPQPVAAIAPDPPAPTTIAPAPLAVASVAASAAPPPELTEVSVSTAAPATKTGTAGATKAGAGSTPDPKASAAPLPAGLGLPAGLIGPTAGPSPGGAAAGGSRSPLSGDDVQRTVQANSAMVRRACWEPALAARSASASKTARVVASISVAPDGHVKSASASGGDAYPTLAGCIQQRVRGWTFPQSGDGGDVNVPFVFAAQ